eukprot:TRINITY_DN4517_c0_g1_i2.p1 TRINITY_DN4517_c0_g1~~TRINITY_DN4517_c0_g1_i2.p1  ORF type:complete len:133 (+),score=7.74 TRINITY_DN4517_c0_g1_i2:113-511(+)
MADHADPDLIVDARPREYLKYYEAVRSVLSVATIASGVFSLVMFVACCFANKGDLLIWSMLPWHAVPILFQLVRELGVEKAYNHKLFSKLLGIFVWYPDNSQGWQNRGGLYLFVAMTNFIYIYDKRCSLALP